MTIKQLNEKYAGLNSVNFTEEHEGFVYINICNAEASAVISVYGGHLINYHPIGQEEILWMSECSNYSKGKAIRGGVPVCWPWFGAHPSDSTKPAHGFARISEWQVDSITEPAMDETVVMLSLTDNEVTRSLWPHSFRLELKITVGEELKLELTSINTGSEEMVITEALHTYFSVSNVANISISGFNGCSYIDSLAGDTKIQDGDITFSEETDRIYQDGAAETTIIDPGNSRKILNTRSGSRSAVVWNPWIAKSQRMADFGDNEYPGMVCVETANAADSQVSVAPQQRHTMTAVIKAK